MVERISWSSELESGMQGGVCMHANADAIADNGAVGDAPRSSTSPATWI